MSAESKLLQEIVYTVIHISTRLPLKYSATPRTRNLLHSIQGVDYFIILRGPSNGMEMLNFFDEALAVERADSSPILELGDCIIMDNCGSPHGH